MLGSVGLAQDKVENVESPRHAWKVERPPKLREISQGQKIQRRLFPGPALGLW